MSLAENLKAKVTKAIANKQANYGSHLVDLIKDIENLLVDAANMAQVGQKILEVRVYKKLVEPFFGATDQFQFSIDLENSELLNLGNFVKIYNDVREELESKGFEVQRSSGYFVVMLKLAD